MFVKEKAACPLLGIKTSEGEKGNSATRPTDKCQMRLRLAPCRVVVTLDGVARFPVSHPRFAAQIIASPRLSRPRVS